MAAALAIDELQSLLRERGFAGTLPSMRLPAEPPASTGVAGLDALLEGGLLRGEITELSGAASSGCTSAAMAMLAAATQRGEAVAWVDAADQFHPASAEAAGVELSRLLLVRCRWPREAWDAVNLIVAAGGFGMVVLDLMGACSARQLREWQARPWLKLKRSIEHSPTVVVVAATQKGLVANAAETRLELQASSAVWGGKPGVSLVLEGLDTEARLAYQRNRVPGKRQPGREAPCSLRMEAAG